MRCKHAIGCDIPAFCLKVEDLMKRLNDGRLNVAAPQVLCDAVVRCIESLGPKLSEDKMHWNPI